jgi:hypothetical protein
MRSIDLCVPTWLLISGGVLLGACSGSTNSSTGDGDGDSSHDGNGESLGDGDGDTSGFGDGDT